MRQIPQPKFKSIAITGWGRYPSTCRQILTHIRRIYTLSRDRRDVWYRADTYWDRRMEMQTSDYPGQDGINQEANPRGQNWPAMDHVCDSMTASNNFSHFLASHFSGFIWPSGWGTLDLSMNKTPTDKIPSNTFKLPLVKSTKYLRHGAPGWWGGREKQRVDGRKNR